MFEVPDWETDVPKTNAVFKKKSTNKSYKSESSDVNPIQNVIKNPQIMTPVITNGTAKKKKPKKRKRNSVTISDDSIFKEESKGFEFDELLVNAKKNKLNEIYKKDDCEALHFGEDTAASPKSKSHKKNKQNTGLPSTKSDSIPPKTKRKHSNEDIDGIILKAKKIKLNDKDSVKNEPLKRKDKLNAQKKQNNVNGNEEKNKFKNEKVIHTSSANKAVSDLKQINNDAKKKEKFKKILEHITPINVTGNKLRERMLDRLKAAQFRYLNEKLYTSSGNEAQKIFKEDPSAFRTYHLGYQLQVKKWPVNPLDVIVKKIQKMPKTHVIADMGCGEAALSKRVPNKVHSFDLVASAPGVVECDMARTPLLRESMDVVVYCLALMGTELTQYLIEANRVLKTGGQLLIAEVESRFDDVNNFTKEVERLGFKLKNLDKQHSVFFFMHFVKVKEPPVKKGKLPVLSLKPCIYKRR